MNRRKLNSLQGQLESMRRSSQRARALESLAKKLGRVQSKRGKEPVLESAAFSHLRPVSIPRHGGGRDISTGVKHIILSSLEEDIAEWEEKLDDGEQDS